MNSPAMATVQLQNDAPVAGAGPRLAPFQGRAIKLLAVIEATSVGGPAGNLIDFCRRARDLSGAEIDASIVTFIRNSKLRGAEEHAQSRGEANEHRGSNQFVAAALEAGVQVDLVDERFRFDPGVIARLRQIVEERTPDIIQTHNVKSHFLMRASGLGRRFPWVAFHHGYTDTDLKMRAYNKLDRWSLPHADRVVTVSRAFATQLERKGVRADRIRVLHNSVSFEKFDSAEAESGDSLRLRLGISPDEQVVLAVGRLSREKGHSVLMSAFNIWLKSRPADSTRLVIVGDGPERGRLLAASESVGIADRVIFAGQVSDVRPYYKMADVMALPSYTEGSPNVLLEAMAAGVPIVATAVGGVPEIVTNGESALLTPAGDAPSLAAGISALLHDRELARELTGNARSIVCRDHSPESRVNSLIGIYHEIAPAAASSNTVRS
ncbi:MAG TPA: glycosyltransferase [Blastocatellia bacterium]|nr:glycosyltransferase [Blastocatellia bacterium]